MWSRRDDQANKKTDNLGSGDENASWNQTTTGVQLKRILPPPNCSSWIWFNSCRVVRFGVDLAVHPEFLIEIF